MIVLGHTARWHSKMFCPLSSKGELQSTVAAKESICCQSAWIKPFIIWPLCWSEPRMKRRPRWRLAAPSKEAVGPSVWCRMLKKMLLEPLFFLSSTIFSCSGTFKSLFHSPLVTYWEGLSVGNKQRKLALMCKRCDSARTKMNELVPFDATVNVAKCYLYQNIVQTLTRLHKLGCVRGLTERRIESSCRWQCCETHWTINFT